MKSNLIYFSFLFFAFSCNFQNSIDNKKKEENSPKLLKKGVPNTILDSNEFVHTVIKIKPFSIDSIIVDLTFYNESNDSFLLYKPLLPSDSPQLSIFNISTQGDYQDVDFIFPHNSSLKYYSGNYNTLPTLIPELKSENFISLPKSGNISFSMNIVKFYNFKKMLNKGKTDFDIDYINLFPEISNLQPVTKRDPFDGVIKPVYTAIYFKEKDDEITKVGFSLKPE
jgi:hypothetical protein